MTDLSETKLEDAIRSLNSIVGYGDDIVARIANRAQVALIEAQALIRNQCAALTRAAEVVEKIEGLRELSEAATAGPWQNGFDDLEGVVAPNNPGLGNVICIPPLKRMYTSLERWPGNADFLTAAANTIREILTPKAEGGDHG